MINFIKNFRSFILKYRAVLFTAVFFMILVDVAAYLIPYAISYITDNLFPDAADPSILKQIIIICLLLLGSGFVRGLFAYIMIHAYWYVSEAMVRDIRNAVYEKLQYLDLAFYDQARTGDLMSRVTTDMQLIRNFLAWGIEHRLRIIIITATVFVLMLIQNWTLALIIYSILPAFFFIILKYSRKMRKAVDAKQKQVGVLASRLQENLSGIWIVKSFAMGDYETEKFKTENEKLKEREVKMSLLQMYLNPLLLLINGLGSLAIILYGGFQVINGIIGLGVLLGFIAFLGLMGFPVSMLAFNTSLVNLAGGAGRRIKEILDTPDQKRLDKGTRTEHFKGKISFRNVCFAYDSKNLVLDNLNFDIEPGEKVALFGLTGAGKSTLISLIPRFYPPVSGQILIDGHDINEWELKSLRSQIGIVLQETFLFSTTIRENISFGKPGAGLDEIKNAARHAQIHDFIESLPEGYETVIGEYGIGLSGGQRQRIAIARTLLQDPKILILDDCTSSLDTITEQKIQAQLKELMKGRTTIIIAQRIAAFAMAGRIIVLNRGTIQSMDSHAGLMKSDQLYRRNYQAQMIESPGEDSCS